MGDRIISRECVSTPSQACSSKEINNARSESRNLTKWVKYAHCGYKLCKDVGKFDPATGEKIQCVDKYQDEMGIDEMVGGHATTIDD